MLNVTSNGDERFRQACADHRAGRWAEAEAGFRAVLAGQPNEAAAHFELGNVLFDQRRFHEAIEAYRAAIARDAELAGAQQNLALAALAVGEYQQAVAAFREAIARNPAHLESHVNLASALWGAGEQKAAIETLRGATRLAPNHAVPHANLAAALLVTGKVDDALQAISRAVELDANRSESHNILGNILTARGDLDGAAAAFRRAIEIQPGYGDALNNLGNALGAGGQIEAAIESYRAALRVAPASAGTHSNLVYRLHFHPAYGPGEILREHLAWNTRHAEPMRSQITAHGNDRAANRPLRIGYVSPDFCDHVVGRNVLPLLRHHDGREFHVVCYSNVARPDGVTALFKQNAAEWRDTAALSDTQLADLIRADRIDILVDLSLHMGAGRMLVFARKPAPIQVSFAGYPATTGLAAMDYRLTDPFLDAPGQHDDFYAEESVRLPHTFWCYDPLSPLPAVNALPAILAGHVVFGCLNSFWKVNDSVAALWGRLMRAVPGSRLAVGAPAGSARERLVRLLDVDASRVSFVPYASHDDYLAAYHAIDLCLDTFPYNGHTTSLDALWMGVPVITRCGQTAVSRAGFSQLSNLGMTELVAQSDDQFITIATQLAGDLPRLRELHATLRARLRASTLMNPAAFARDIESAYRHMWRRWCESTPAAPIPR